MKETIEQIRSQIIEILNEVGFKVSNAEIDDLVNQLKQTEQEKLNA